MKKFMLALFAATFSFISFAQADTAYVNNKGELVILTNTYTQEQLKDGGYKKLVYYVNVPPTYVSPPNNGAYSHAGITEDFIYFSGVTGQDLAGNPVPVGPNGITQITQAYNNMLAVLDYFKLPVTQVTKLDVAVAATTQQEFQDYRSSANQVQSGIWTVQQPPRTIQGVSFLNLGILEVTFTARNPYKLKVKSTLSPCGCN